MVTVWVGTDEEPDLSHLNNMICNKCGRQDRKSSPQKGLPCNFCGSTDTEPIEPTQDNQSP
ncbi:hypothetical protein ACFL1A_03385 [Patescibacteria group bacterium]